ncbi:hypothetical protein MP638_001160 [Amoeboaphelidium occidentale]|nr:hypothetical protein MP638_001160 [Amoeboaphelidium occidentale]
MSDQRFIPPDTGQDRSERGTHVDQATPMNLDATDQPTNIVDIEMEQVQRTAASAVDVIAFGADVDAKSLSDDSKQSLKDAIEDAVNCASDIYVDATRFLHGYIIWLMERNHPVPDLRHSEGISHTVNILAKNYATNCMNHIQMNIYKWLKQHVRYKLHKHVGSFVSAKSLTTLEKNLMHQLSRKSFQNNMVIFPMDALRIVGEPGNDTEKVTTSDIFERVVRIWDKTVEV